MTSVVELVPTNLTGLHQLTKANLVPSRSAFHHLPLEPTPLIGREIEIGSVVRLLADQGVRLVTLSGPGGVGKTRIALSVAKRISGAGLYPGGAWFVDLSTIRELQAIPSAAIAEVIGNCPGVTDLSDLKNLV